MPLTGDRLVHVDEPIPRYVPRWIRPMIEAHRQHERERMAEEETTIIRTGLDFGADTFVTAEAVKGLVGQEPSMPGGHRCRVMGARALPDGTVELDLEVPQHVVDDIGVNVREFSIGIAPAVRDRLLR